MDAAQPIKVYIDLSADGQRAAFVALIVEDGKKPRLIYGTGGTVAHSNVEAWGIKRALKRINTEHNGARSIVVFTDDQRLVRERMGGHVRYCWLPRKDDLMRQLHRAVTALRRSLRANGGGEE